MEAGLDWDSLPEELPYQDDGCELWPHCLDCPFPTCIKEEPWGIERFTKLRRTERMLELKQGGKSTTEIARIFDCSPRTVQRWLRIASQQPQAGSQQSTKLEILSSKS